MLQIATSVCWNVSNVADNGIDGLPEEDGFLQVYVMAAPGEYDHPVIFPVVDGLAADFQAPCEFSYVHLRMEVGEVSQATDGVVGDAELFGADVQKHCEVRVACAFVLELLQE